MLYLLIILFPLSMAASSFLLRKRSELTVALGVLSLLVQTALVAAQPAERPARLLGMSLTIDPLGQLFLLGFLAISAAALLATLRIPHGENFVPVALLITGLSSAALLLQDPFTIALLLVSAAVLAVLAIVDLPPGSSGLVGRSVIAAALKYLVLMVFSGVMMYMAFILVTLYEPGEAPGRVSPAHLTLALLVVGFGLRLAVMPFHAWLPDLVDRAAPMVSLLIITVINTTSLLFLVQSLQIFPIVVFENERGLQIMQLFGGVAALAGALMALAQDRMRRVVSYLIVHASGVALFGLATASVDGVTGALADALGQLVAAPLLLISLAVLELPDGRAPGVVRRDLLWRWPMAGFGLLMGGMSLLGVPPLGGYPGRLLIYHAAAESGAPYLGLLLVATAVALLALTRLARERLFGEPEDVPGEAGELLLGQTELDRPAVRRLERAPRSATVVIGLLLVICLAIGLYPQPLVLSIQEIVRGMPFVRF